MKHVDIYTDGACRGNPGKGGWGAILIYGKNKKEMSGGERLTTNNRMELTAVIMALKALKEYPCEITLTSDSKYVLDALSNGWAVSWREKGWKKADKSPALNPDLCEELLSQVEKHQITYVWVKGHNGHPYNERCDKMAQNEADTHANN